MRISVVLYIKVGHDFKILSFMCECESVFAWQCWYEEGVQIICCLGVWTPSIWWKYDIMLSSLLSKPQHLLALQGWNSHIRIWACKRFIFGPIARIYCSWYLLALIIWIFLIITGFVSIFGKYQLCGCGSLWGGCFIRKLFLGLKPWNKYLCYTS